MRRVILVGGPRTGKSTIARKLREDGIPTFCTDPLSKVKDPEQDVRYFPEDLKWEAQALFIAQNWLTLPAPWCCEGVQMARAVRKLHQLGKAELLKGVEIHYLTYPFSPRTAGQIALAKAIETVWQECLIMMQWSVPS